jgi:hypothetical protein
MAKQRLPGRLVYIYIFNFTNPRLNTTAIKSLQCVRKMSELRTSLIQLLRSLILVNLFILDTFPVYAVPDDTGSMLLLNVGTHLPDYTVSQPRRAQYESSQP